MLAIRQKVINRLQNDIFISAIGAGGGQGILFNFSLGAEEDMVAIVRRSLERI